MGMPVLALKGIDKRFGGIHALRNVDFSLEEGEVHALLGENGAGKSTLIKILTGVHHRDGGQMLLNGTDVRIENPLDARKKGIAAIYQELSLIESLTVAENIFLGHEPATSFLGTIRRSELFEASSDYLRTFGIKLDPRETVSELGMGQKRIIEIIKALSIQAKVLLLDEPTTGMSQAEIETLFEIMDDLKKKKVNMIYISHHLDEVFRVCDRATVLRDGENAGTFQVAKLDVETLVQAMLGRSLKEEFPPRKGTPSREVLLEAREFQAEGMVEPVDFHLHRGEILGITGIIGSGKSELALGLFGASRTQKGALLLEGKHVQLPSPSRAKKMGISFVPEDRKAQGLFLRLPVRHNLNVAHLEPCETLGFLSGKKMQSRALRTGRQLKVVPLDPAMPAQNLSGGNQQKVVIGKWLGNSPRIFILDEPTRGIDIGAKTEIYALVNSLADSGASVLILSSEFREMASVCDRVLVMRKGTFIAELEREGATTKKIMTLALGG